MTQFANTPHDDMYSGFDSMPDDDLDSFEGNPHRPTGNKFEKRTPTDRAETLYSEPCSKCNGTGSYRGYSTHGYTCFTCNGKGVLTFKTPKAQREKAKLSAAARKERKADEALATFEAAHPEVAAWWKDSTFPFAVSMRDAVRKWGDLTAGQLTSSIKCADKFKAAKSAQEVRQAAAPTVDISGVRRAFERVTGKLKSPKLRLFENGLAFEFSLASEYSKNAGSIYVKGDDGVYLGKISGDKFMRARDCTDVIEAAVVKACQTPEESAVAYGKAFGICSCCGRTLTNALSISLGIGPICRGNFFGA